MQKIKPLQRWRSGDEEITVLHSTGRVEIHYHQRGEAILNNVVTLSEPDFRRRFTFVANE
jgi:hypothetical protein